MWGSRSTISGEDTLELVHEDFRLLLATPMLSCFLLLMYFQKGFELFVLGLWYY